MTKFVGIKLVDAVEMSATDAKKKGYRVETDEEAGFEVTYEEGYKSWCPSSVFLKHNSLLDDEVLYQSAKYMLSTYGQDRLIGEYIQLKRRIKKLDDFIKRLDEIGWDVTEVPRGMFVLQLQYMNNYLTMLEARAKISKIELVYPNVCCVE